MPVDTARHPKPRGSTWKPGCVFVALAAAGLLVVFGFGVGLRYTYWHHIGDVQAFEGPDRVVLFVEVERRMRWPGILQEAPWNYPAAFLRVDVFPDGRVDRSTLACNDDRVTFNTNLFAVVHLANDFFLISNASYDPTVTDRLEPAAIVPVEPGEASRVLGGEAIPPGGNVFELSMVDGVSIRHGWRRINHDRTLSLLHHDVVVADRLGIALRHEEGWVADGDGDDESIVARSEPPGRWSRLLLKVDNREWKSYSPPDDRAYLKQGYARSPATW